MLSLIFQRTQFVSRSQFRMSSSRSKRKEAAGGEAAPSAKRRKTAEVDAGSENLEEKFLKRIKMNPTDGKYRCLWSRMGSQLDLDYHDSEWGRPVHDDQKLFEFLALEGFQAGLSWSTILAKRQNFIKAFDNFDPKIVSTYGPTKVGELLQDAGIVRHKGKIEATIKNAQIVLEIQKEFGSFDKFLWSFVSDDTNNPQPIVNNPSSISQIQSKTEVSDKLSKELQRRGAKFLVG
eukprot:TRINITY_DN8641_c0_g1_i1.p1 TRINITY_DN8641_c0_g1~~TRINITY_DN8641_c0_g1_i1.p1  ORF type:complete len:234 (-),score=38.94 TRINITY_DN8641_c0_g1_i1:40-741(-)